MRGKLVDRRAVRADRGIETSRRDFDDAGSVAGHGEAFIAPRGHAPKGQSLRITRPQSRAEPLVADHRAIRHRDVVVAGDDQRASLIVGPIVRNLEGDGLDRVAAKIEVDAVRSDLQRDPGRAGEIVVDPGVDRDHLAALHDPGGSGGREREHGGGQQEQHTNDDRHWASLPGERRAEAHLHG